MTVVQQRITALCATLVLVVGCLIVAALPQQSAYAAETNLVAGSTFNAATRLAIANKTFSASNKTEFNATADNNFYKFVTSKREARYQLTVRSYNSKRIYGTVYDAGHHRIAYFSTAKKNGQSWVFQNLKRNSTYYIELWRFMTDTNNYIASGTVLDKGNAEVTYPPYKITLTEKPIKPKMLRKVTATSPKDHTIKVTWGEPSYNAERVQIEVRRNWTDTGRSIWYQDAKATARSCTFKAKHFGENYPYKIRTRAYMVANGKKIYGRWSKSLDVIVRPYNLEKFTVASTKKKHVTVSWGNAGWKGLSVSKDNVQVQLWRASDGKTFEYTVTAKKATFGTSLVNSGTKAYKARVRICQNWNGEKVYGAWSKYKWVDVKS